MEGWRCSVFHMVCQFLFPISLETLSLKIFVELELNLQFHNGEKSALVEIHTPPPI